MNETLSLPQIIARIAQLTGADEQTVSFFIKEFIDSLETALSQGQSVKLKNFGHFFATTNDIRFIPDTALAEAVNQPFAAFEAIELPEYLKEDTLAMLNAMSEMHAQEEAAQKQQEQEQNDVLQELGIPSKPYILETEEIEEKPLSEVLKEIQGTKAAPKEPTSVQQTSVQQTPKEQTPEHQPSSPDSETAAASETAVASKPDSQPEDPKSGEPTILNTTVDFEVDLENESTPGTTPPSERASNQDGAVHTTVQDPANSPESIESAEQPKRKTPREVLFFFDLENAHESHKASHESNQGQPQDDQTEGTHASQSYASEDDQIQNTTTKSPDEVEGEHVPETDTQRPVLESRPLKPSSRTSSGPIIDWESISNISHSIDEEETSSEHPIVTESEGSETDYDSDRSELDVNFGHTSEQPAPRKTSRTINFDDNDEEGMSMDIDLYENEENDDIHFQDEDRIPASSDDGTSPLLGDDSENIFTASDRDQEKTPTTDSYIVVENGSEGNNETEGDNSKGYIRGVDQEPQSSPAQNDQQDEGAPEAQTDSDELPSSRDDNPYIEVEQSSDEIKDDAHEDTPDDTQRIDEDQEASDSTQVDEEQVIISQGHYDDKDYPDSKDDEDTANDMEDNSEEESDSDRYEDGEIEEEVYDDHKDNDEYVEEVDNEVDNIEVDNIEVDNIDDQEEEEVNNDEDDNRNQGFRPLSSNYDPGTDVQDNTESADSAEGNLPGLNGYGYGRPSSRFVFPDNQNSQEGGTTQVGDRRITPGEDFDNDLDDDNTPEEPKINPWRRWAIAAVLAIIVLCGCLGLLSKCGCNVLPFLAPQDTIVVDELIISEPALDLSQDEDAYDTTALDEFEITDEDGDFSETEDEFIEETPAVDAQAQAQQEAAEKAKREAEEKAKREAEQKRLAEEKRLAQERERAQAEAEWRERQQQKAEQQKLAQQKERERAEAQKKAQESKAQQEAQSAVDRRFANGPIQDVVSPNRTLAMMAADYYGSSYYWVYIYEENQYLGNPNQIMPGTKVNVPPLSKYVKGSPKDSKNIQKAIQLAESINSMYN